MSEEEQGNNRPAKDDDIDLITLVKTLREDRRTVIKTVIIFVFLGLFIAIFSPKEFTATTAMVPQINNPSTNIGGLSSLASLAGFNLDMNMAGNDISPMLYPQILSSISFQLEIMNAEYRFEEIEENVSLYDYYLDYYRPGIFSILKKYTIGLPGVILKAIHGEQEQAAARPESETIRISTDQEEIRKKIEENLTLNVNDKEGYLTLSSNFHQAELSAQVAKKAQKLLQDYITKFKIEKATAQFQFIEGRYKEKKREFEAAQRRLASYRDANKNISSAIAQTELEKLENEYQLAFEVYSELAKQMEQARIQVKEDTPVFSIIEEVVVPVEKSKPKRALIIIIWLFFGILFGIGWVFGKNSIKTLRMIWQEK